MLSRKQRWAGYWECSDRRKVWILFIYQIIVSLQYWVTFCHREVWVLNKVVKEGLTVKVSTEGKQRKPRSELWVFEAEGAVRAKVLRQEQAWCVRQSEWLAEPGWERRGVVGGVGGRLTCVHVYVVYVVCICVLLWCLGCEEQLL